MATKSIEKNKKLCEKYPFLTWHGDPLYMGYSEDHEVDYSYTWEDEVPEGWRKAFCPQMWDELKEILEKADCVKEFRWIQIKEKYGTLRLYYGGIPTKIADEVYKWEEKYEDLSEKTCIDCGKPATHMSTGWINFVCRDCAKKRSEEHEKWYGIPTHFVKIENIDEFYKDRKSYWEKHKDEEL